MNIVDYVITPVDVWRWLKSLGRLRGLLLLGGFLGFVVASKLGVSEGLSTALLMFYLAVVLKVDARIPFIGAIILLVGIAVLSVFDVSQASDRDSLQNTLAVYAYYCLVFGVLLLIRDQAFPGKARLVPVGSTRGNAPLSSSLHTHKGHHGATPALRHRHNVANPLHTASHSFAPGRTLPMPAMSDVVNHQNQPAQGTLLVSNTHKKAHLPAGTQTRPREHMLSLHHSPAVSNSPSASGSQPSLGNSPSSKQALRRNRDARLMDIAPSTSPNIVSDVVRPVSSNATPLHAAPSRTKHSATTGRSVQRQSTPARRLYGRTIQ